MPSLALSTITPLFEQRGEVEQLDVVYANIRWLDFSVREAGLERENYELIVDAEADASRNACTVPVSADSSCSRLPPTDPFPTWATYGIDGTCEHEHPELVAGS
ncbi:hypothetical protein ABT167_37005 [Streptomyces sp. NPDC001792]|uniref:hypothetical protein n=1 Tax=Streptomyces sp. NPDC001792 TaxID=3154524 RepID=UPI003325FB36